MLVQFHPYFFGYGIPTSTVTLDGQTTAHYLADRLQKFNIKVTRLAHGVPVGGELDFLDDGTIAQALKARNILE